MNRGFYKRSKIADKTATIVLYIVACFFLILLAAFTVDLIYQGIKSYNPKLLGFDYSGLGVQLFNTIYMVLVSLIISVPLGIGAGIYMAEYAKPGALTNIIRLCIETLSSLPSIVVGLFGFLVFITFFHVEFNMLAGSLTLSILCIPLITRTTEDAISEIPEIYAEGSYALGTTKWQTIVHVLIPSAIPRIITGVILAAGRGFGEAAALIYTAGMSSYVSFNNWNPFSPTSPLNMMRSADSLAVRIWFECTSGYGKNSIDIANMAAAILIILVFAFNLGSRFIGHTLGKNRGL